ncbi:MAG: asparagine synthase-related protein [Thermoanaerobaculales bacterium]|jgi:asparagine synthase (glutamine-hydrolysing)|nr:asparagine synthase-related protein [Thermoanaerobaculales bacterium]
MSGVATVFARDGGVVSAADVDAVLQRQAHRGPDGLKLWCDGPIGLGHAALDPTGAGFAVEPLIVDGGRLAITGDLRIDNRRDLAADLDLPLESVSDAGIVLAAYRRWGVDVAEHLVGAFAFVIWDAQDRRVVCVRDHLGQKPLTYHLSEKLLVCASEAEAVPCHPEVPRRINEARIADFLVSELEGVDHTSTFFEGVFRLPPAHVLVVEPGGHRLHRYWEPDVETELRLGSDDEYVEAFSENFQRAVQRCLIGVDRPAILLSGGIDSSAIAATAASLVNLGRAAPVTAYSLVDDVRDATPETDCIRSTIEGLRLDSVAVSPEYVVDLEPSKRRALLDCGEPFDGNMVAAGLLYAEAADRRSKVVLDGVDGDIVASASVPVAELLRSGRAIRAWRESASLWRCLPGNAHPLRAVVGGAARAWLPRLVNRALRELIRPRNRIGEVLRESSISPEFARNVSLDRRFERLQDHSCIGQNVGGRSMHAGKLIHPYVTVALERYDRVAARHGVETRHPFFDLDLIELCLALPWDQKIRGGWTKSVLRSAMSGHLKEKVRYRRDNGSLLWLAIATAAREERGYLSEVAQEGETRLRRYVDPGKLADLRETIDRGPTFEEGPLCWEFAVLVSWFARIGCDAKVQLGST